MARCLKKDCPGLTRRVHCNPVGHTMDLGVSRVNEQNRVFSNHHCPISEHHVSPVSNCHASGASVRHPRKPTASVEVVSAACYRKASRCFVLNSTCTAAVEGITIHDDDALMAISNNSFITQSPTGQCNFKFVWRQPPGHHYYHRESHQQNSQVAKQNRRQA